MNLQVVRDKGDISALVQAIERARGLLDQGDVETARMLAEGIYDEAKAAASFAARFKASEVIIAKARRLQADALLIETLAVIAIADRWRAAKASGLTQIGGRPSADTRHLIKVADTGLDKRRMFEASRLSTLEHDAPGTISALISDRVSNGLEPSRSFLRKTASASSVKRQKGASPCAATLRTGEHVRDLHWYELQEIIRQNLQDNAALQRILDHCIPADPSCKVGDVFSEDSLSVLLGKANRA
ncbi:hypothetical protein HGO38_01410 [Rhizobium sp. CG5]|uniref:hypothetical protein n=1 Tax=Rhizobium sp. CG5 TaxID=2726076 RepID=UPI002034851C|nr:hypothetical protein [Rhizobium sp. CG5]MCM2472133.1 hypothetical protein [Rhizobium sp. CG5]